MRSLSSNFRHGIAISTDGGTAVLHRIASDGFEGTCEALLYLRSRPMSSSGGAPDALISGRSSPTPANQGYGNQEVEVCRGNRVALRPALGMSRARERVMSTCIEPVPGFRD
jgi:hypothetical protein